MRVEVSRGRFVSGRPRSVRVALVVAAVVLLLVVLAVAVPVWTLITGADATVAGALDVPGGRIAVVTVLGVLVVVGLAVGLVLTSRPTVAWVLTVVIGLVALVVALYPLLATAQAAVDQGKTFVPWLTNLVVQLRG